MRNLTSKQAQILNLIRCYIEAQGKVSTYGDIAHVAGISHANICRYIKILRRKGYIVTGRSRNCDRLKLVERRPS